MRVSQALADVDFGLILTKKHRKNPPEFPFSLQKIKAENFPFMKARKK